MSDREWSNAEKKIARRAYEAARQAVLAGAMAEFKAKAVAATTADDMWSVGDELRQRRRELQELLDYRYSQLPMVFGRLIFDGYLDEQQLSGLAEDKLAEIRRYVSFMRSR
jgi:Photoprotection regulator fluorescence recovery protein